MKLNTKFNNLAKLPLDLTRLMLFKKQYINIALVLTALQGNVVMAAATFWDGPTGCSALSASWDAGANTCTMTQDYTGDVTLVGAGITLDGAGHTISLIQGIDLGRVMVNGADLTLKNINIVGSGSDGTPSGIGVMLFQSNNSTVENVNVSNTYIGIGMRYSSNNTITESTVSDIEDWGIEISEGSSNNAITNNTLSSYTNLEGSGIYLGYGAYDNTVSGNTISNFLHGLELHSDTNGNNIYQNNFIDNHFYSPIRAFDSTNQFNGNYYSSFDEGPEGCSDEDIDGFCDEPYAIAEWANIYDNVPWVNQDGWVNQADATGPVTPGEGGVISTEDESVVIEVDAESVGEDVTITVDIVEVTDSDIFIGDETDPSTALAIYEFGPDGTAFDPAASLTLKVDASGLSQVERDLISIYRHEDTDLDGDIDSDDGFIEMPGTTCETSEEPVDTFIVTCAAPIDHFSSYALIFQNDADGDGIADSNDECPAISSAGFDVDSDGCIDSFAGLVDMVSVLVESGVISDQMKNSLLSKIENADKSISKDNTCAAINQIYAFKNQVEAQRVKMIISDEAADDVLTYTDSIVAYFYDQLDAGETCS